MNGAMDSKKTFQAKLAALGLSDLEEKMKEIGATTMAEYAFCASGIPGKMDETTFINEIVKMATAPIAVT